EKNEGPLVQVEGSESGIGTSEVVGNSVEEASPKPFVSEKGIPPTPKSLKEHKGLDEEKEVAEGENEERWSKSEGGLLSNSREDKFDETVVKPKEPL
ncbi:hypothetical protein U1Q18_041601, partial [Sarracenia purpurea var. burkii]